MQSTRPFILFFNSVRRAVSFNQQLQKIARTELVTSKSRDEFFSDLQGKYKDISVIYMTSASGAVSFLLYRNVNSQAKSKAKQLAGRFDVDLIHHHLQTCKHSVTTARAITKSMSMHAQSMESQRRTLQSPSQKQRKLDHLVDAGCTAPIEFIF